MTMRLGPSTLCESGTQYSPRGDSLPSSTQMESRKSGPTPFKSHLQFIPMLPSPRGPAKLVTPFQTLPSPPIWKNGRLKLPGGGSGGLISV